MSCNSINSGIYLYLSFNLSWYSNLALCLLDLMLDLEEASDLHTLKFVSSEPLIMYFESVLYLTLNTFAYVWYGKRL